MSACRWLGSLLLAIILPLAAHAEAPSSPVKLNGDVRLRLEEDWDSRTAALVPRADRLRMRIRARVWATVDLGNGFQAEARVRTAASGSQQNANITFADFNGNPVDKGRITPDRYALHWKRGGSGIDVGRMAFPFFTPNEYFWDADISPLGGAGHIATKLAPDAKLTLNAGAFRLPVGLDHFVGSLYAGQGVLESGKVLVAAGVFRFVADKTNPVGLQELNGNGRRNYTVLALNGQVKTRVGKLPIALNADFYRNLETYSGATDPFTIANRNQRSGYVLSATLGDLAQRGHVQAGYRYAHIQALAVNASYAHDDLARFGTPAQTSDTDIQGHDLFVNWQIDKRLTLGGRAIFMRRITNGENDKRARVDVIYAF